MHAVHTFSTCLYCTFLYSAFLFLYCLHAQGERGGHRPAGAAVRDCG